MRKCLFLPLLIAAMALLFVGCGMFAPSATARSKAYLHVQPVISALKRFHRDHDTYPTNLVELSPTYLKGDLNKYLEDQGLWSLDYKRIDAHEYELWFRGVFHDAEYKNGKFIGGNTDYFR